MESKTEVKSFMKWKEKMYQFMQGRYGVDSFSKFLLWVAVACILLSAVFRNRAREIFNLFGWAVLVFTYYRMLSKNYAQRSSENQSYLRFVGRIKSFFQGGKTAGRGADKTHKVFKCPTCGQKARVPRGKGMIEIDCPRCHTKFRKRT